jgi:capsular polysaccharide biosynthesis protein
MKKEEKENKKELPKKKSKKGLIILIAVSVVVVGAMVFFSMGGEKVEAKKTIVKTKSENKIQKVEVSPVLDTASVLDTLNSNIESEISDPVISENIDGLEDNSSPVKKNKKIKIDHENNPKNWSLVQQNGEDTSFYIIKNKITGTKLVNRYYSKLKGDKELQSFKNILSN